jgi:membrane associated rhomboid family serine protease
MQKNWHLTEALIASHFVGLFVTTGSGQEAAFRMLGFFPGATLARPWTLFTYQLIHSGIIWFIFSMLILWIMGRTLESEWGSPRFLVFWLVSTLGAVAAAAFLGQPLAGDIFLGASLLFAFATLYPDTEFLMMLILPVKVKYLAVIGGAFLVFASLQMGWMAGVVNLVGSSAGYLFFLATRRMPTRRKLAFELSKQKTKLSLKVESVAAESRNRGWDPQVREAESRAREAGAVAAEDEPFLAELDEAVDPTVTVCAPAEFGYVDDDVCRSCVGYAECAARRIRIAADEKKASSTSESG